ncbi:hypothetical protein IG631_12466 [Alternaria alternata]|nr:hypothetical protein IG631_12466 [Alternaria alternata]
MAMSRATPGLSLLVISASRAWRLRDDTPARRFAAWALLLLVPNMQPPAYSLPGAKTSPKPGALVAIPARYPS